MKAVAALVAVALLLPGHVLAASDYERCLQEEATLRKEEKEKCSGLSYLLNPSGCFAAQKAVKAFTSGACPGTIKAGSAQPVPVPPAPPLPVKTPPAPAAVKDDVKAGKDECDRLWEENVRLKVEVDRLRSEIERLKKQD
ncbi:MAG TPA: hypothetical protein VL949_13965 [Geobacteraceae bacterium]|nr:hypothetical protein [Geobacteraceae bacterium]